MRDGSGRCHGHPLVIFPKTMEEGAVDEEEAGIYGAAEEVTSSSSVCSCATVSSA